MPGPIPKHASARARRNRHATTASLHAPEPGEVDVPDLPRRTEGWHSMTQSWWADLWASPMAAKYDDSDQHGLLMLAALIDGLWRAKTAQDRLAAAAEVRLQGARYGLSPIDRRRLQWEIERAEPVQDRSRRRLSPPETVMDDMASAEKSRDILRSGSLSERNR